MRSQILASRFLTIPIPAKRECRQREEHKEDDCACVLPSRLGRTAGLRCGRHHRRAAGLEVARLVAEWQASEAVVVGPTRGAFTAARANIARRHATAAASRSRRDTAAARFFAEWQAAEAVVFIVAPAANCASVILHATGAQVAIAFLYAIAASLGRDHVWRCGRRRVGCVGVPVTRLVAMNRSLLGPDQHSLQSPRCFLRQVLHGAQAPSACRNYL